MPKRCHTFILLAPNSMRLRAAVLLVCVLLPSAAATTIQAGQSPDGAAGPPPGGLVVVIPSALQEDYASVVHALNNPLISGVALQIRWRDLEPSAGKPDWSRLDRLFAAAQSSGKWVQLLVFPGFYSPPWALDGVETARFPIQYGPGTGTVESLPMPWDKVYLTRWFAFLRLVSDRYGKSAAFKVIAAAGPTSVSAESTLPSSAEDVRTWLRASYTPQRYIAAWREVFQTVAASFPRQYVSLSLGFGLNINDRGKLDATERSRTRQTIVDQGMALVGHRFVIQDSNLDGNQRPDRGTDFVIGYNGRIVTGFQLRTSCVRESGNMGAQGDPPLALRRALDKGLKPNNAGHRVNYLEVYEPDVLAEQMQPPIRYGASLFRK